MLGVHLLVYKLLYLNVRLSYFWNRINFSESFALFLSYSWNNDFRFILGILLNVFPEEVESFFKQFAPPPISAEDGGDDSPSKNEDPIKVEHLRNPQPAKVQRWYIYYLFLGSEDTLFNLSVHPSVRNDIWVIDLIGCHLRQLIDLLCKIFYDF